MAEVDICIRSATLSPITELGEVDCFSCLLILVMFTKLSMMMKEVIVVVVMKEVDLGLNIPATLPFKITEDVFMMMGELYIGIIPATIPPIIQLGLVN